MTTASVNGIDISYLIHDVPPSTPPSKKPWVVLINGLADTKESWNLQIPAISHAGYQVLSYDNRGVGQSSRPIVPYTAELLAADLKALVDHLKIPKPFHVHGVSMGGMISQTYALHYPSDVLSLTLSCTYAAPNEFCTRRFNLWAEMAKKMSVATVMQDVTAWCFTQGFFDGSHDADLKEFDDAMANIDISTEQYLSQLNVIQVFDTRKEVEKLANFPVLVLAGEEDILIPTNLSHQLHQAIPNSMWVTVKGGHGCAWEFPDDYNKAMIDMFQAVDGSTQ